jgi:hypothetical protein
VLGTRKNSWLLMLASGAAGAAACWTKQPAFSSILFVLLYAIFAAPRSARVRNAAAWMGGALLFSAALTGYFAAHGLVREFLYWSLLYGFSYVQQLPPGVLATMLAQRAGEILASEWMVLLTGIGVAVWGLLEGRRWAYFVLGFLALSVMGTLPGFAYPHYFLQLAPAVALAAGQGLAILGARFSSARIGFALAAGFLALAAPVVAGREYFFASDPDTISRDYFGTNPFPDSRPIAEYLAENTQPSDPVFIAGSEPQILFYAQRRSPSVFLMLYPLMTTHPRYREFQQTMIGELQRNPPKYIVALLNIPTSILWDQAADPEIMRVIRSSAETNYTVERIRLVSGPHGEWVQPDDSRLTRDSPLIYIFRRKS